MTTIDRVIVLVLDGVGVGELPDAATYGDAGSNTLAHVAERAGGLALPTLEALGLGHIGEFAGVRPVSEPDGCFGKMAELSRGKDTTVGHWEMAGLVVEKPFPTYPKGFPAEIIEPFQRSIGRPVLGNKPASGTEILKELGEQHLQTGAPIVYTSADSVFQVAAHEQIISVEELYRICREARKLLQPPHQVARVIARPFRGEPGAFIRTEHRRDFSLDPPEQTLLDHLKASGQPVIGIGKIHDLFNGRGLTRSIHTSDNAAGMEETLRALTKVPRGFIFVNLVDFDSRYGHRNDITGYATALRDFDSRLPAVLDVLRPSDLLVLTADHGNDPTTAGTDHTREHVPLLTYGPRLARGVNLGVRRTFADLGQTIADVLGSKRLSWGESFLVSLVPA
ncbi:MAG TPA: phosphopentomutase [Nitrospiraceae bacterium]|jgi:phosphopentomutase|nr:phosphopentomutase [Nitrospiraceae bacterium]